MVVNIVAALSFGSLFAMPTAASLLTLGGNSLQSNAITAMVVVDAAVIGATETKTRRQF